MSWPAGFEQWRVAFLSWLASTDQSNDQLLRWMDGHDLPAEDLYVEPPYWLSRAMMDNSRAKWASMLATRVAKILADAPRSLQPDKSNDRILANILALCASLARPGELAGALEMFAKDNDLSDRKNGVMPLNVPLRFALTFNQADDRFFPKYWRGMIESPASSPLPGDALDGLDGVLMIPGKDLQKIGWALRHIAQGIKCAHSDGEARDMEFQKVLSRVSLRRPDLDDDDLFSAARQTKWPKWAINLLPVVRWVIACAMKYYGAPEDSVKRAWAEALERAPITFFEAKSMQGVLFHQLRHIPSIAENNYWHAKQGYQVKKSISQCERIGLLGCGRR